MTIKEMIKNAGFKLHPSDDYLPINEENIILPGLRITGDFVGRAKFYEFNYGGQPFTVIDHRNVCKTTIPYLCDGSGRAILPGTIDDIKDMGVNIEYEFRVSLSEDFEYSMFSNLTKYLVRCRLAEYLTGTENLIEKPLDQINVSWEDLLKMRDADTNPKIRKAIVNTINTVARNLDITL